MYFSLPSHISQALDLYIESNVQAAATLLSTHNNKNIKSCQIAAELLMAVETAITAYTLDALSAEELSEVTPKERILELLMQRFDAWQQLPYRAAEALFKSKAAPVFLRRFVCFTQKQVRLLLTQARLTVTGPIGIAKVYFVTGLYIKTLLQHKVCSHASENVIMQALDRGLTWGDAKMTEYA